MINFIIAQLHEAGSKIELFDWAGCYRLRRAAGGRLSSAVIFSYNVKVTTFRFEFRDVCRQNKLFAAGAQL